GFLPRQPATCQDQRGISGSHIWSSSSRKEARAPETASRADVGGPSGFPRSGASWPTVPEPTAAPPTDIVLLASRRIRSVTTRLPPTTVTAAPAGGRKQVAAQTRLPARAIQKSACDCGSGGSGTASLALTDATYQSVRKSCSQPRTSTSAWATSGRAAAI